MSQLTHTPPSEQNENIHDKNNDFNDKENKYGVFLIKNWTKQYTTHESETDIPQWEVPPYLPNGGGEGSGEAGRGGLPR